MPSLAFPPQTEPTVALAAATIFEEVLQEKQTNVYETNYYTIERDERNVLTIYRREDGSPLIALDLNRETLTLERPLSAQDVNRFQILYSTCQSHSPVAQAREGLELERG